MLKEKGKIMPKLTPPSMKNRARRKKFFKEHSELPNAVAELLRIENEERKGQMKSNILNFKKMIVKSKSKKIKTKGAFGKKPNYLIKQVELEVI